MDKIRAATHKKAFAVHWRQYRNTGFKRPNVYGLQAPGAAVLAGVANTRVQYRAADDTYTNNDHGKPGWAMVNGVLVRTTA